jgi:thiosulfate/3-mercaptopyruvate sulfurtransferase
MRATVTHLEMHQPFPLATWNAAPRELPDQIAFVEAHQLALPDYRQLYHDVGDKWFWVNRKHMDDATLATIIHSTSTEIHLLCKNDKNIGFVELNLRNFPSAEIVFVGLIESYIGIGLGRYMLSRALWGLAARGVRKLIIQTCSLDHPNALALYQEFGFAPVSFQRVELRHDRFHVMGRREPALNATGPD